MHPTADAGSRLLRPAAIAGLLVLALGATGLFALHLTNVRTAAALDRLDRFHTVQVSAVETQVSFKTQVQEWKDLLLRGHNPADFATYREHFTAHEAAVQAGLARVRDELAGLGLDPAPAARLLADHAALGSAYRAALARFQPAEPASTFATDASIRGIDRPLNTAIDALAHSVDAAATAELAAFRAAAAARYALLRRITFGASGLAVLAAFWLVFLAARAGSPRPPA